MMSEAAGVTLRHIQEHVAALLGELHHMWGWGLSKICGIPGSGSVALPLSRELFLAQNDSCHKAMLLEPDGRDLGRQGALRRG